MRKSPIFLSNTVGEDVIQAVLALPRRLPTVMLRRSLVDELEVTPAQRRREPTVFLLRSEHRKKPPVPLAGVSAARAALAGALGMALGILLISAALETPRAAWRSRVGALSDVSRALFRGLR
jgi:hypothetical protein